MKRHIYFIVLFIASSSLLGCKNVEHLKTTIKIEDNHRHYYPILRGQELNLSFTIINTGQNAFTLSEILSSCGCITTDKSSIQTIPPGKSGKLLLTYDSRKNIGYVKNYISLYGNLENEEKIDLIFDVNVVPNSAYTKDYEEIYIEKNNIKRLTEGSENQKKYYLDKD